ncbi:MAG: DUF4123 domain-containing protein [Thermoanaerobaculia bacterium]|nr:DUF4123 domain-containing protein [Thermoanaerobaculia bacterium]
MASTVNPPGSATGNRAATPYEEVPLPEPRQRLFEILTSTPEPLYAVLDAARDLKALNWSKESGEEYQSLYDGDSARDLEMFAPYLVRFSKPSPLLRKLVAKAWGQSWGIYLTSAASFPDLRKHFRHFLIAQIEGGGDKNVYFRFYDPRVLRVYLPTCTPQEVRQFFGPIGSFLLETEDASRLLRFRAGAKGLEPEDLSLEKSDVPRP